MRETRPPAASPSPPPRRAGPRRGAPPALARWLAAWAGAARGRAGAGERALHDLADLAREAREPGEVRRALAGLARRVPGVAEAEVLSSAAAGERARPGACAPGGTLHLPLRAAGHGRGTLVVRADGRRGWPARSVRLLTTMAALAAAAEHALAAGPPGSGPLDPATGLPDAAVLAIALEKSLAQARRRGEGLTLMAIGPDGLGALRAAHGPRLADAALGRIARAVVATLRAGDLVVRLPGDRLAAVLPGARAGDAPTVAEAVRRAIAEAGLVGATPCPLTACLGTASFPDAAEDAGALLAAATSALARARSLGRDRIAAAPFRGDATIEHAPCAASPPAR